MEITRGSLDQITRAAANNHRSGSRVSVRTTSSASLYRHSPLETGSSLEILPPEDTSFQEHDIEVEEFYSGSDDDDYEDVASSDSQDDIPQNVFTNHHLALRLHDDAQGTDSAASSTPDDTNYDTRVNGNNDEDNEEGEAESDDPENKTDPKIEAAMRKMRQLDRILAKRVKREKEVKRQRLELHRQLQRELEGAKPEGRDEQKEVTDNTTKFLALVPPSSHNEGVPLDEDLPSVSPVFATQPLDTGAGIHRSNRKPGAGSEGGDTGRSSIDGTSTNRSSSTATSNAHSEDGSKSGKKNKSRRRRGQSEDKDGDKDFVRRNIELATDAGNLIAMTDDEKKRLEDLLQDVEMLAEEGDEEEPNPFHLQLQVCPGIGYQPDADEQKMLQDIDARLQALMPPDDFMSISSTPTQSDFRGYSSEAFDLGEKILQDTKQGRSQQERLHRIEEELSQMQNTVELEMMSPRISDARMSEILQQCDDLSSRATSATSSYISSSSTDPSSPPMTTEIVPRLSEDVLRSLLNEARESGISTDRSLSTVNEDEGGVRDFDLESEPMTGRYAQAGALVSYDMIQELLRNPRARSVANSTPAIESARSQDEDQRTTSRSSGRSITPVMPSSGRSNDYEASGRGSKLGMGNRTVTPNNTRDSTQRTSSSTSSYTPVESPRSTYDVELEAIRRSAEFERPSGENQQSSNLTSVSSANNSLDLQSEMRPSKTRGSSRIAFAESSVDSYFSTKIGERKLSDMRRSDDSKSRLRNMPTPPQMSRTSPKPQQSKLPSASRSKKSKSRASSNSNRSTPSQAASHHQEQDLRLTSVSASTSYASVTDGTDSRASENTLVSSSDFEYEEDDDVMQEVLRKTPGSMPAPRRYDGDERDTPPFKPPLPKLNRGVHSSSSNRPALPVDSKKIKGIENYADSDDDSEKNFSPVFF